MADSEQTDPIQRLIEELKRLPGIGPKSAQRLVFHLLKRPADEGLRLAEAIQHLKESLSLCSECHTITSVDPCRICDDPRRDRAVICVVEEPPNIFSIERSGEFNGLYHVLHGVISPINDIGPDELGIDHLLERIEENGVQEVILATNPTSDGETTAMYLSRLLKPLDIRVTRIGLGIPVGGDLEYADSVTISRALAGRQKV